MKLLKDIVIPAGTELHQAPNKREYSDCYGNPAGQLPSHFVEVDVELSKDHTATFTVHIDDGIESGYIG